MNIIDLQVNGSFITIFLGENGKQWGDDWDDAPFEHNAGQVYDKFVKEKLNFCLSPEYEFTSPSSFYSNSPFSMESFRDRKVPRYIITKQNKWWSSFEEALCDKDAIQIYFGDSIDELKRKFPAYIPDHITLTHLTVPLEKVLEQCPDFIL